jgi:K+ transporter
MRAIAQSYLFIVIGLVVLGYLGSGALITTEMGAMGVSIWKFALSAAIEIALGALLTTLVINKLVNRGVR